MELIFLSVCEDDFFERYFYYINDFVKSNLLDSSLYETICISINCEQYFESNTFAGLITMNSDYLNPKIRLFESGIDYEYRRLYSKDNYSFEQTKLFVLFHELAHMILALNDIPGYKWWFNDPNAKLRDDKIESNCNVMAELYLRDRGLVPIDNPPIHYIENKKPFIEIERIKAIDLINNSSIFDGAEAGGKYLGKTRDFILKDGTKNLFNLIRDEVIEYFIKNKISWWMGKGPTGHVLSSQIACINHLFAIRKDKAAVLRIVKSISPDFDDVLIIESDEYSKGYISFEVVSSEDHLNEGHPNRGSNCTSIDALIFAKHMDGSKWLIPIEWKYTEHYDNQDKSLEGYKKDPKNCKGTVRKDRYTDLINNSDQLKSQNHNCYYFEPFYQLMRQTLWIEQLIKNKHQEILKADNYLHIHVIPTKNNELLFKSYKCSKNNLETTWKSFLKYPEKYRIISPEDFVKNSLVDKRYQDLKEYLTKRYW